MPNEQFQPQNELEVALLTAAADTAARPHFYQALLNSDVLVVPVGQQPTIVNGIVQGAPEIGLKTVDIKGQPHTPFFSSEKRLPVGTQYLGLKAKDFFRITKGAHLILNPGSDYGKLFVPTEIAGLLDGSLLVAQQKDQLKAPAGSQRLIGQPKDYPQEFAGALARFFAAEPTVERAYLAQHFIAGVHTEPALLIAIVAPASGFERVAAAVGVIARETKKSQHAVDVTRLERPSADSYFENQKPIYENRKRGLLKRLFG